MTAGQPKQFTYWVPVRRIQVDWAYSRFLLSWRALRSPNAKMRQFEGKLKAPPRCIHSSRPAPCLSIDSFIRYHQQQCVMANNNNNNNINNGARGGVVSRSGSAYPNNNPSSQHGGRAAANSRVSCNRCRKPLSTTVFVCSCDCVFCEGQ